METESGFTNDIGAVTAEHLSDLRLQDFRLIYESGHGMMRIFTARRSGRIFIVKTLREQYKQDPVGIAALNKEYDLTIAVDSPNVAKAYDFLDLPKYGISILAEYCSGITLQELIESGAKLTSEEADNAITGILRAIDDIHAAGVIHRDIKPSNIVYNPSSASVKVIDFGCADAADYEIFRGLAGTPQYTPESVKQSGISGPHHDLYAAGITLRQILPLLPRNAKQSARTTASRLISGQIQSGRDAIHYYRERNPTTLRPYLLSALIFTVIVVALTITVNHFAPNKHLRNTAAINHAQNKIAQSNHENESERIATETSSPTTSTLVENPPAVNVTPSTSTPAEKSTFTSELGENEADKNVIETADKILISIMNRYNDAITDGNIERKEKALSDYHSSDYVIGCVEAQFKAEGRKYDKQHISTLIKERMKLWHQTYKLDE